MRGRRRLRHACLCLWLAACGGAQAGASTGGWPTTLVSNVGTGPALFIGPEETASAVGYLSPGVTLILAGAPHTERVLVQIDGAMKVRAFVSLNRLGARALREARIEGTHVLVRPGDLVDVFDVRDGVAQVAARVPVRDGGPWLGPFAGTLPVDAIGAEVAGERAAMGTPSALPADRTVTLHARPQGEAIETIPVTTPPALVWVLAERNGWSRVLVGAGPSLVGYAQGTFAPASLSPSAEEPARNVPLRIEREQGHPLHRVAAGTTVQHGGRIIGQLNVPGWARELGRNSDGEVDVFVAVDDDVALRGFVPAASLTPAAPAVP